MNTCKRCYALFYLLLVPSWLNEEYKTTTTTAFVLPGGISINTMSQHSARQRNRNVSLRERHYYDPSNAWFLKHDLSNVYTNPSERHDKRIHVYSRKQEPLDLDRAKSLRKDVSTMRQDMPSAAAAQLDAKRNSLRRESFPQSDGLKHNFNSVPGFGRTGAKPPPDVFKYMQQPELETVKRDITGFTSPRRQQPQGGPASSQRRLYDLSQHQYEQLGEFLSGADRKLKQDLTGLGGQGFAAKHPGDSGHILHPRFTVRSDPTNVPDGGTGHSPYGEILDRDVAENPEGAFAVEPPPAVDPHISPEANDPWQQDASTNPLDPLSPPNDSFVGYNDRDVVKDRDIPVGDYVSASRDFISNTDPNVDTNQNAAVTNESQVPAHGVSEASESANESEVSPPEGASASDPARFVLWTDRRRKDFTDKGNAPKPQDAWDTVGDDFGLFSQQKRQRQQDEYQRRRELEKHGNAGYGFRRNRLHSENRVNVNPAMGHFEYAPSEAHSEDWRFNEAEEYERMVMETERERYGQPYEYWEAPGMDPNFGYNDEFRASDPNIYARENFSPRPYARDPRYQDHGHDWPRAAAAPDQETFATSHRGMEGSRSDSPFEGQAQRLNHRAEYLGQNARPQPNHGRAGAQRSPSRRPHRVSAQTQRWRKDTSGGPQVMHQHQRTHRNNAPRDLSSESARYGNYYQVGPNTNTTISESRDAEKEVEGKQNVASESNQTSSTKFPPQTPQNGWTGYSYEPTSSNDQKPMIHDHPAGHQQISGSEVEAQPPAMNDLYRMPYAGRHPASQKSMETASTLVDKQYDEWKRELETELGRKRQRPSVEKNQSSQSFKDAEGSSSPTSTRSCQNGEEQYSEIPLRSSASSWWVDETPVPKSNSFGASSKYTTKSGRKRRRRRKPLSEHAPAFANSGSQSPTIRDSRSLRYAPVDEFMVHWCCGMILSYLVWVRRYHRPQ